MCGRMGGLGGRMAVCVGGWEMEDGRFRCEDGCLCGRMGGGGWEV